MDMEIREVDLEKLEPAPYNPREISGETLDGLAHSIGEFGLVETMRVERGQLGKTERGSSLILALAL
jgi:ParB-like chromosome segregation protein Spo0J